MAPNEPTFGEVILGHFWEWVDDSGKKPTGQPKDDPDSDVIQINGWIPRGHWGEVFQLGRQAQGQGRKGRTNRRGRKPPKKQQPALHKESGWSEYVFVNSKTFKPLTDVKKAFTSVLRKAGIEDFHFHDLRHTCATRLGDRGASAFEIAQIMGWSDIRMAMLYTHATGDGIRRAMQLLTQSGVGKGKW